MEIVVVGHLSRDLLITPTLHRETLGGGTAYAMLAPSIGAKGSGIVSRVGQDFGQTYEGILQESGLDLTGLLCSGSYSTRFVNEYDNQGQRTQRIEHLAPSITAKDLLESHINSNIIHFCPLTRIEIEPSCFQKATRNKAMVSLDIQGFSRGVHGEQVIPRRWSSAEHIVKYVDVIKSDESELLAATNTKDIQVAIDRLFELGLKILLLTCEREGSTIYTPVEQIDIPLVLTDKVVDTTGCGDTYAIGFLIEYNRSHDLRAAGIFAAACSSFNLEDVGPYRMPSRAQVESRMRLYM
ncbi:MAG: carbohydrate kinase family protein [Candidatus Thorarchaeota archaeon]